MEMISWVFLLAFAAGACKAIGDVSEDWIDELDEDEEEE